MLTERHCPCGMNTTNGGEHYCTLIGDYLDAGKPQIDVEGMAREAQNERLRQLNIAEDERKARYFTSFLITQFTGNPLDGMLLGGDAMGAAAAAAEIRGEHLEQVIKDNMGAIKDTMKNAGMSDGDISSAIDSYLTKKRAEDNSWF